MFYEQRSVLLALLEILKLYGDDVNPVKEVLTDKTLIRAVSGVRSLILTFDLGLLSIIKICPTAESYKNNETRVQSLYRNHMETTF
jgi:hypothetical protein